MEDWVLRLGPQSLARPIWPLHQLYIALSIILFIVLSLRISRGYHIRTRFVHTLVKSLQNKKDQKDCLDAQKVIVTFKNCHLLCISRIQCAAF